MTIEPTRTLPLRPSTHTLSSAQANGAGNALPKRLLFYCLP
jgi:hypothetical protein